jgi:hypothetical protein
MLLNLPGNQSVNCYGIRVSEIKGSHGRIKYGCTRAGIVKLIRCFSQARFLDNSLKLIDAVMLDDVNFGRELLRKRM